MCDKIHLISIAKEIENKLYEFSLDDIGIYSWNACEEEYDIYKIKEYINMIGCSYLLKGYKQWKIIDMPIKNHGEYDLKFKSSKIPEPNNIRYKEKIPNISYFVQHIKYFYLFLELIYNYVLHDKISSSLIIEIVNSYNDVSNLNEKFAYYDNKEEYIHFPFKIDDNNCFIVKLLSEKNNKNYSRSRISSLFF